MTITALPQVPPVSDEIAKTPLLSPWQLALRRFRKHTMALVSLGGLVVLFLYIFFGGFVFARGLCGPTGEFVTGEAYANCNDLSIKLQPPSRAHFFWHRYDRARHPGAYHLRRADLAIHWHLCGNCRGAGWRFDRRHCRLLWRLAGRYPDAYY